MKLHLPSRLRKALLACLASLVVPAFSVTVSSGSALVGSATLVSFFLGQHAQAEGKDDIDWDDEEISDEGSKTADELEQAVTEEGHGYKKIGDGTLTITEGELGMPIWVFAGGFTLSNGVSATGDIFVTEGGTLTLNGNTLGNVTIEDGGRFLTTYSGDNGSHNIFENLTFADSSEEKEYGQNERFYADVRGLLTIGQNWSVMLGQSRGNSVTIGSVGGDGKLRIGNTGDVTITHGGSIGALDFCWTGATLTLKADLEVAGNLGKTGGSGDSKLLSGNLSGNSHLVLGSSTYAANDSYASFLTPFTNIFTNDSEHFTAGIGIGGGQSATFTENNTTWDHSFIITSGATLTVQGDGGFAMGSGKTLTVGNASGAAGTLNLNTTLDLTQGASLVVNTQGAVNVGTGGVLKASSSSTITGEIALSGGTLMITEGLVSLDALKISGEGSAITIGLTGSARLNLTAFEMEGAGYGLSINLEGLTTAMQDYQLFDQATWNALKEYEERITFICNNRLISGVSMNEDGTLHLEMDEQRKQAPVGSTLVWAGSGTVGDGIWVSEDADEEWHVSGGGEPGELYGYENGFGYSVVFGEGRGLTTSISLLGNVNVADMDVEDNYSFAISADDTSSTSLTVTGTLTVADEKTATFTGNSDLSVATLAGSGALDIEGVNVTITTSGSGYSGDITVNGGSLTLGNGVTLSESSIDVTSGSLTLNGNTLKNVTIGNGCTLSASELSSQDHGYLNTFENLTFADSSTPISFGQYECFNVNVNDTLTIGSNWSIMLGMSRDDSNTIGAVSGSGTLRIGNTGHVTITNGGSIGALDFCWSGADLTLGADLEVAGNLVKTGGSGNSKLLSENSHLVLGSSTYAAKGSYASFLELFTNIFTNDSAHFTAGIGIGGGQSATFTENNTTWDHHFIITSGATLTVQGEGGFTMGSGKTLTVGNASGAAGTLNLNTTAQGALVVNSAGIVNVNADGELTLSSLKLAAGGTVALADGRTLTVNGIFENVAAAGSIIKVNDQDGSKEATFYVTGNLSIWKNLDSIPAMLTLGDGVNLKVDGNATLGSNKNEYSINFEHFVGGKLTVGGTLLISGSGNGADSGITHLKKGGVVSSTLTVQSGAHLYLGADLYAASMKQPESGTNQISKEAGTEGDVFLILTELGNTISVASVADFDTNYRTTGTQKVSIDSDVGYGTTHSITLTTGGELSHHLKLEGSDNTLTLSGNGQTYELKKLVGDGSLAVTSATVLLTNAVSLAGLALSDGAEVTVNAATSLTSLTVTGADNRLNMSSSSGAIGLESLTLNNGAVLTLGIAMGGMDADAGVFSGLSSLVFDGTGEQLVIELSGVLAGRETFRIFGADLWQDAWEELIDLRGPEGYVLAWAGDGVVRITLNADEVEWNSADGDWTNNMAGWHSHDNESSDTSFRNANSVYFSGTGGTMTLKEAITVMNMTLESGAWEYTADENGSLAVDAHLALKGDSSAKFLTSVVVAGVLSGEAGATLTVSGSDTTLTITGGNMGDEDPTFKGKLVLEDGASLRMGANMAIGGLETSGSGPAGITADGSHTLTVNVAEAASSYSATVNLGNGVSLVKKGLGTQTLVYTTAAHAFSGNTEFISGNLDIQAGTLTISLYNGTTGGKTLTLQGLLTGAAGNLKLQGGGNYADRTAINYEIKFLLEHGGSIGGRLQFATNGYTNTSDNPTTQWRYPNVGLNTNGYLSVGGVDMLGNSSGSLDMRGNIVDVLGTLTGGTGNLRITANAGGALNLHEGGSMSGLLIGGHTGRQTEVNIGSGKTLTVGGLWSSGNTSPDAGTGGLYIGSISGAATLELSSVSDTNTFGSLSSTGAGNLTITEDVLLKVSSGNHRFGSTSAINGAVQVAGGSLILNGITGEGTDYMTVGGTVTLSGGKLAVDAASRVRLNSGLTVTAVSSGDTAAVVEGGTLDIVGDISADAALRFANASGSSSSWTVHGTLTASNNVVTVAGGSLTLDGGSSSESEVGTLTGSDSAALTISSGKLSATNYSGTFGSLSLSGTLQLGSGSMSVSSITGNGTLKLNGGTLTLAQGGSIGTLDYSSAGDRTISLGGDLSIKTLKSSNGADRILRFANTQGSEVEEDDFVTVTVNGCSAIPSTSLFFGKGVNVDFQAIPTEAIANSCTWTIEENITTASTLKIGNDIAENAGAADQGNVVVGKTMSGAYLTVQNSLSSLTVGGDLKLTNRLTNKGTISVEGDLTARNIDQNQGPLTVGKSLTTNEKLTVNNGVVTVGENLTATTGLTVKNGTVTVEGNVLANEGLTANGGTLTVKGTITGSIKVDGGTLVLNSNITVADMGGGTFERYGIDDDPELEAITVTFGAKYSDAYKKDMTFGKGVNAVCSGGFTAINYTANLTAEENFTLNGNMTVSTGTIDVGGDLTFNSGNLTLNDAGSISVDGALTLSTGNLTLSNGTLTLGGGASIKGTAELNSEVRLNGGVLNVAGALSGSSKLYVDIAKDSTAQLSFSTFGDNTLIQLGFDAAALNALVGTEGYQLFTEDNWQSGWEQYFDLYTLNSSFAPDDYEISITDEGVLKILNLNELVYTWAGTDGTWGAASADEEWNCGVGELRAWQQEHDVRFVGAEGISHEITLSGEIEVRKMMVASGEYTFTANEGEAGLRGEALALDAGSATFTGDDAAGAVVSFGSLTGSGSLTVSGSAVAVEDADGFAGEVTVSGGVLSLNGADGLGLTGDIAVAGGELELTTTAGSVALGAVEVSGGELKLNAGGRVDSLTMDGGKVSIAGAQSTEIGAVKATGGALEVAPAGAVALNSLTKSGAGTLTLSGGAIAMVGGISIDSAGRVDVAAAASLDISGGLSFILGAAQNSPDTAYLHGIGGNIAAAHAPAGGIGLSITGELTSGIYYLASGLDAALTLDSFGYDGVLDALRDELRQNQPGEVNGDWNLALDLADGVLSLNVFYVNTNQWIWDGPQSDDNVWSDSSNANWNQTEGNTGVNSPQVYFYSNGAGEIVVANTVTPGAMVVRGGHYVFTHLGDEGGIDLQGGVGSNRDNADGEARLIIGGDHTEAHVELNLKNKNIPLVDLLENGKLTIGHMGAVNEDALITMDGGMLAIGEGDNGALILSELGKMKITLENGSALRLQVGKSYEEFDSADEYRGVASVARYAARDTGTQTFTLMGADVVKEALTNGIDKTGRRALVVLVGKNDLQGGAVTGAFAAQEGTLALVYSGAAEIAATAALSVTEGATLRLEAAGAEQLTLKSGFTHVAASADLAKMLGEGAAARVELAGNVALDAAADNSAYAGVMALEGLVTANSGASLGGAGTELELDGGTLALGNKVQEVSVGTIRVAGDETISPGAQQTTLKAEQVTGNGTLAIAAGDTLTLEADMTGYAGTLQANKTSWTLAGKQSSDTLGMSLSGEGAIVFSDELVSAGSSLILTGTIGAGGSVTSLANEMNATKLVIAGDGSGSTGSLSGDTLLGSADCAGSWGGATLEAGATLTLVNGTLSGKPFTKGEGAALVAAVERGCAVDVNGMDGANFDAITVKADGQLQNVSGTITAGGKKGITVSLLFGTDNVGSSDGGDYLITGGGTLLVEDAAALKLDFTNESFYKLLMDHREKGVESRLLIYKRGAITLGGAAAEAEAGGMLSSALIASNFGKLLYDLGFNATVGGGDIILTGTSADVYLVVEDNEEVSNADSVDGWFQGLGGHKATVVDGTLDVTAGDMAEEAKDFGYTWDGELWTATDGSGTTKTDAQMKAERELTDVQLEGVKNDQLNGGRTVNNLVGTEWAELNAHNSKAGNDGFDPQADRERIVFNNSTLGSYDAVGMPGDADAQLAENSGMDTVFAGTINGDEGVDFVKKGAGSLTVGTESGKGGVKAEGSDFTLEGGSFIVQGGSDNRMRDLVFADGENEGCFGFSNGSKTRVGRIVETDGDGGHVSITGNAELTLSGNSALEDTQISGDGSGKLMIKSSSLSFSGTGAESTALDNVNVTVAEGASLALNGGAGLSGGDVTVMGKGGAISLSDDSHLNTDGNLTLETGSRLDLGNSSGNSAGQLNGRGVLAGGLNSSLDITGVGGVFSGSLTGMRNVSGIVTGGGTLRVAAGAELTLDDISTDADHKWTADVDGSLTVDVTAGDRVNLDITLNNGASLNYMFNSAEQIDLLTGDLKVNGQAGLTLTSDGQELRAGRYDLGLTLARGDVEGLRLSLEGLALSHYSGVLVRGETGLLSVELSKMVDNSWMRPNQEKNAKAGAAVFWDATDPESSSNEYIQDHPDGDLAQFAGLLYWANFNEDYAGMDRALAAGVGASVAALSPAVNRDVLRQLSMLRNRAAMADATPAAALASGEPHFRMWMSAESGYYKMNADGLAPGFTLNGWGGSVGMDAEVRKNVMVGCSITAMYNDVKTHSADAGSGDVDTTYLSAYASVKRGAWTHSLVVTGGLVDTTLNRTVSANPTMEYGIFPIAGHTYTARGETSGYALGAMYEVGYTCTMNEAGTLALQPVANVQVVHSALDGYTEGGSDAGLNVGGISQTQVTLGLGARLQGVLHASAFGRDAVFETRALAKLDAADRSGKARNSLKNAAGMAAEVESARAGAVGIELGAGLSVPIGSAGGSIFMDASVELRNHADMVNVTAGYRLSF